MLRNIMRSLSWFTALCLALCLPAVAESTADDPVVVRVGQFSYPLSVVQGSLDSAMDVASLLSGEEATDALSTLASSNPSSRKRERTTSPKTRSS